MGTHSANYLVNSAPERRSGGVAPVSLKYDVSEVRTWKLRVNLERMDIVGVPRFLWILLLGANSFCFCGTFLRFQNTGDLGHHLFVPFCLVAVEASWWLSPSGALCSRPPSGESALCIVPGLERIFHSFKALPEASLMLSVRINYYTFSFFMQDNSTYLKLWWVLEPMHATT